MCLLLVLGAMLANQDRETELAKTLLKGVCELMTWIKGQPAGRRLYDHGYNPYITSTAY